MVSKSVSRNFSLKEIKFHNFTEELELMGRYFGLGLKSYLKVNVKLLFKDRNHDPNIAPL